MRLPLRYTVDHTTMRTFGEEQGPRAAGLGDPLLRLLGDARLAWP